ncbi:MAG: recombinase RecA [Candidatus Phytoplasma stylosanthis]|uniref:recombinase RecA n=1 Tax=Candidatus Phytoplasma stylosanthis TaxID=2798314 RepID=UPI0029395E4A|nr:recombinase RecA [Candidatus Phytoplasma stylosanthis]MDV3167823.1 recombinase RecA [Candidatus Phytoplasma stylosanthis]MDV3170900.1 recombinase RecA [Candidatus Phytoplasma stylosanthis]MDV3173730.1 recombinase RecA [Candidatus Phytoplasma stylosanthis]MDV3174080.1 recombinase RecA [Candidatus Phytoplasma stylosanthis]MDV3202408.1 recombinase RecA [Candidatus Phytoplasma stylosanthis]
MNKMNNENKTKDILEQTLKDIEKRFGKGSIMKLNSKKVNKIQSISTGSLNLDIALEIGGFPKGRIIEIYGLESSGKTTLALHAISEAQKQNGNVAFVDVENALDINYAKKIGVDIDNFIVSQPDSGEKALDIVETLIKSEAVSLIVVDSVAALAPEAELKGESGDSFMGLQARMMGQAMRKQSAIISKTNTTVIYVNQLRDKVGVIYGSPEVTPGGKALKYFASLRLDIRRSEFIKNDNQFIGIRSNVKIVKSKVSSPFKVASFEIIYGQGISKIGEILDLAVNMDLIQKNGSWFSYKNEKIGQGRETVKEFLIKNKEITQELEIQIKKSFNLI